MHRLLVILLLLVSTQLTAQFRDKCPNFVIKNRPFELNKLPIGQWDYSIRHRQYQHAIEFGYGIPFFSTGYAYSPFALTGSVSFRPIEDRNIMIHQDWIIQFQDNRLDTLGKNKIIPMVNYVTMSASYQWHLPKLKAVQSIGIGTGTGDSRIIPFAPVLFIRSKYGIDHNLFMRFNYWWNFNKFLNLRDDRIFLGFGIGWYLDEESKYHR